jgi:hypothetical protein
MFPVAAYPVAVQDATLLDVVKVKLPDVLLVGSLITLNGLESQYKS